MADDSNPVDGTPQTDEDSKSHPKPKPSPALVDGASAAKSDNETLDADPVETAWRIQTAIMDWMGKVDLKASFTFTLDAAVLGGVLALSKDGGLFAGLGGFSRFCYVVGLVLLAASAAFAVGVVLPKMRGPITKKNFIYFGNLRKCLDAEDVEKQLRSKQVLPALAEQLYRVSGIAWKKHTYIQYSLGFAAATMIFLVLSFLTK
ncbi:Pycsar system effector family protein [Nocardia sp. CA-107356]|uniref:Pycsar system effector family protein n=1 Tax=Nocardia sp. CA-107356 TaxID=3239972 RepID=UPI003D8EAD98